MAALPSGRTLRELADPRHPRGFYVGPHLLALIVAVVAVVAFAVGFGTGVTYDQAFFQHRYDAPLRLPTTEARAPVPRTTFASLGVLPRMGALPGVFDQLQKGACAANASSTYFSWLLRTGGMFGWPTLSRQWMYDWYSDTYSGGLDRGSWPDQDVETAASVGIPREKSFPYTQGIDPAPLKYSGAKPALRFQPHFTLLTSYDLNQGVGAVDAIKGAIASGKPALIALAVYSTFDNATQTAGNIGLPPATEATRGGHEVVGIAFDDSRRMPDGTAGAVEIRNSWTIRWGINGNAWLSYSYIEKYTWGIESATVTPLPAEHLTQASAPGPLPPRQIADGRNPGHRAPFVAPSMRRVGAPLSWYVTGVRLTTGQDVSGILNAIGDRYRISPLMLAATVGTESALNPRAERWAAWPDDSCGLMQQTLQTLSYYGVTGSGRQVCDFEEVPQNSIEYGGRIYRDYYWGMHQGRVPFPWAYGMYNAGGGYGDAFYLYTYPSYPGYRNFLSWYTYAMSRWQCWSGCPSQSRPSPRPQPRPVNLGTRISLQHLSDRHGGYWKAMFRKRGARTCTIRYTWPWQHFRTKLEYGRSCARTTRTQATAFDTGTWPEELSPAGGLAHYPYGHSSLDLAARLRRTHTRST